MFIRVNVVLSLTRTMTKAPVVETSVTINNNESNLWTTLTQTILLHLLTN